MDSSHKAPVPFGYILDESDSRRELEAQRPDGPNLLSIEDQQQLDAFFADMTDNDAIDPNLFGGVDDGQANQPQQTFTNHNPSGFQDYPSSIPQFQPTSTSSHDANIQISAGPSNGHHLASYGVGGVGPHTQPMMSSQQSGGAEDVFAAQQLQNMQGRHTPNHYAQLGMPQQQAYPGLSHNYQYPYQNSNGQQSRNNSGFSNPTPATHTPSFEQARAGQKRGQGLPFGSDESFQEGSKYNSPAGQMYPDINLLGAALANGLTDDSEDRKPIRQYSGHTSPGSGQGGGGHHSNAAYDGEDEQQSHPRKRSHRDADLSNDDEPSTSRRKSAGASTGGRKQYRASVSSPPRRKSSAAAVDPASPPGSSNGGNASRSTRQNLTEDQKRTNHIQSEQKRRNLIKEGFDQAKEMVPELRVGNCTKGHFLVEAARFMRTLKEGNASLKGVVEVLDKG